MIVQSTLGMNEYISRMGYSAVGASVLHGGCEDLWRYLFAHDEVFIRLGHPSFKTFLKLVIPQGNKIKLAADTTGQFVLCHENL